MKLGGVFDIEMGPPRLWSGAKLGPNWCVVHVGQGLLTEFGI